MNDPRPHRETVRSLHIVAIVLLALAGAIGAAGAAQAPPDAEAHKAWMNDATDQQDEIREALAAKSGAKAAAAATKLAALMGKTESYWSRKKAADIVTLAQESRRLAAQVAASARAGKFDRARGVRHDERDVQHLPRSPSRKAVAPARRLDPPGCGQQIMCQLIRI